MEQPRRKRGRPRVPVTEELIEARRLSKKCRNRQQRGGNDFEGPSRSAAAQLAVMPVTRPGSDSRLRLWDVESCCNTLVNFDIVRLQTSKAMQLAVSPDSDLVFVPCMSTVKALSMWSGQTMLSFRSHYDNVNSCWYNEQDQDLYTGGSDRQILVWSPFKSNFEHEDEWNSQQGVAPDQDNWSD